ncbi:outer membrane beta-barrel protein [Mesorhizobium sp. VK24D]|uniref:Outer membrane beta-barrel protein n=1 Tax=Mesorhizobium album TaxID=3072314 RepID=A0ABU4XX41_9HYPH|nr:outer membrane beta-barrel protein [Mesorhizobium sp. VK24D]MDX8479266.1 outer membrane beta-barrel protein [Mesorhizobium sp. VK24D]
MTSKSRIALALAAIVLMPATQAVSADYNPPIYVDQAPDYQPVEVGSGWYLRGDIGYAFNKPYDFSETPAGVVTDVSALSGSIGMGYHFNDYLRGELNFGLLPTSKYDNKYVTTCEGTETTTVTDNISGTITSQVSGPSTRACDGSDYTRNKAYDVMASAFVDLGTYVGFTPYVGGGVGLAYSTYTLAQSARNCQDDTVTTVGGGNTTTTSFSCFDSSVYEGTITRERQYNLAYMLGAGFAYQVSKNVAVDLGYEFVSVPSLKYATIDGSGTPSIHKGIDYHQVKVGLRYDLW